MRIIIMGTGPFAVPTAQRLLDAGHTLPLVVTRPLVEPRPKKLPPRPVYDWARQAGLEIFEPPSINSDEAIEHLRGYAPDLLFVCDYGQILSNACLSVAPLGGINLHGSLLPRHRGAAPVQWALLQGDTEAGVTVIHMTPRLDAGPALSIARTEILRDDTAERLEPRLAGLGVEATVAAVSLLATWDGQSTVGEVQDKSLVTKAPRFSKQDGELDFRFPAEYLVRLFKACQPWPGTYAVLGSPGEKPVRLIVRAARSSSTEFAVLQGTAPGSVALLDTQEHALDWPEFRRVLAVQTGEGTLLIGRVQPAGKREMDAEEFLRGHPLAANSAFRLPTPPARRLTP